MSQGWLGEITLRSCFSKEVNTQMEVNDRPNERWRWWMKTRSRFLWLMNLRSQKVIYRFIFFHELELWGKHLLTLFYFLTSINSGLKLLEFRVYFLTSMNYILKLLDIPVIRTPPIRTNFYRAYALLQLCSYFGKFYFCPTGFLHASSETANPTSLKG